MKVGFSMTGIGWIRFEIYERENSFEFEASRVGEEPLHDLLSKLLILTMINENKFTPRQFSINFHDEVDVVEWDFSVIDELCLEISILKYENQEEYYRGNRYNNQVLFRTQCPIYEFISQIVNSSSKVLREYGLVGYRKTWQGHDFPIGLFLELKCWLDSKEKYQIRTELSECECTIYKSNPIKDLVLLSEVINGDSCPS